jgi:homoserine O-acetyltransferase
VEATTCSEEHDDRSVPSGAVERRPAAGLRSWQPGDPAGDRQFLTLPRTAFVLRAAWILRHVTVAYETWGELDADGGNAARLPRSYR